MLFQAEACELVEKNLTPMQIRMLWSIFDEEGAMCFMRDISDKGREQCKGLWKT